ncbi:MAG: cobalamin-dependent protein [Spirochaetales bacterium]|nr:cobalamin-dependent protein [Spirochaetales bacterium]
MVSWDELKGKFIEALLLSEQEICKDIIKKNTANKFYSSEIEKLIFESQEEIGRLWEEGSASLAQVYMSGNICGDLINEYFPSNEEEQISLQVGFAVLSDYHSLGMKIVSSNLKSRGIHHRILGIGLTPEELLPLIKANPLKILLISTLMLPSAYKVKELKELLVENNLADIKIIVGGAPFRIDEELWRRTGADYYCANSEEAYQTIQALMDEGSIQ